MSFQRVLQSHAKGWYDGAEHQSILLKIPRTPAGWHTLLVDSHICIHAAQALDLGVSLRQHEPTDGTAFMMCDKVVCNDHITGRSASSDHHDLGGTAVLNSMLGPHLSPNLTTGVPHDSPLEGQSPWDFALITPGKARRAFSILFFTLLRDPGMMKGVEAGGAVGTLKRTSSVC